MASVATINSWLDQLAQSILINKPSAKKSQKRRIDAFRRRARSQQYARTNQFEVADRLTGMEEKFQILSREDLSDELYERRRELREFGHQWLPDILDLLLRLSGDPLKSDQLLSSFLAEPRVTTPPPLTWKQVEADDPIDRRDKLWKVPDSTGDSSDEENDTDNIPFSSPRSVKTGPKRNVQENLAVTHMPAMLEMPKANLQIISKNLENPVSTQIGLIREVLFMLRGFPTSTFKRKRSGIIISSTIEINDVTSTVVAGLLQRVISVRNDLDLVEQWINVETNADYIQVIKRQLQQYVSRFYSFIDRRQTRIISPQNTTIVSLLDEVNQCETQSDSILPLAAFVRPCKKSSDISCLEQLHNAIEKCQQAGNASAYCRLRRIFTDSMALYMQPIWDWMQNGKIDKGLSSIPISKSEGQISLNTVWENGYLVANSTSNRFVAFLQPFADKIFICGKTTAFITYLTTNDQTLSTTNDRFSDFLTDLESIFENELLPFQSTLENLLSIHISQLLQHRTEMLKAILNSGFGLSSTLDALSAIYLRTNGVAMDAIESKIFARIDHCIDSWNDRYLVLDMIEEVFSSSGIELENVLVHSAFTSSRNMQSRRKSVKILNSLAIEYVLPWPVANIINKRSLHKYQRVALTLQQIRRAKYMLERVAYVNVTYTPVSDDATLQDQKYVQALKFSLLQCVNTIYDHLTTGVIQPATISLQDDLKAAPTFDEMIRIHQIYMNRLDTLCLSAQRLKILKESLISLLDLCIRFADLVSTSTTNNKQHAGTHQNDSDIEASSFHSARSRRRRRREKRAMRTATGGSSDESDEDEDDEEQQDVLGEGYSSFIVLEEDTSIMKEIRKLSVQFQRQLDFFVAGLKGSARGTTTTSVIDDFEILAERLAWRRRS